MNLLDATANSVNTIYAQLVDVVGPSNVAKTAHKLGIVSDLKSVCSITLGTQAVNPLEMTNAYATLAARGVHRRPQAFEQVRGPGGGLIGKLNTPGAQTIPRNTADTVTYALQGVVQHGTGVAAGLGARPVAGKTGTAENSVDAWFCGYVPQLATCVWVGYPNRELPMDYVEGYAPVYGGTIPALIWHDFMAGALWNAPVEEFATPEIAPPKQQYYSYSTTTTQSTYSTSSTTSSTSSTTR
jgi:membrane peptidoglycan carboxypeptidase